MDIRLRNFLVYVIGLHVIIPIQIFRVMPDRIDDRISIGFSIVYITLNGVALYMVSEWSNWGVLYLNGSRRHLPNL